MRKWLFRFAIFLIVLIIVTASAFYFSPRPGAFVLRTIFDMGNDSLQADQESSRRTDVTSIDDLAYREGDPDALLDVYFPASTPADAKLPTLVWTHGGAWLQGSRKYYVPFFQSYANQGFTVVAIGYSLAPGKQYPTPVLQVNDALKYITANSDKLRIDKTKIFMAGDSAGSQITSQIATLTTNPEYAREMKIEPALAPEHLRGVILHCGFYDLVKFAQSSENSSSRFIAFGTGTMVWAYTGSSSPSEQLLKEMSAFHNANANFPPTFISGGNADPLTDAYSKPFAEKLKSMGVDVTKLFFPPEHEPKLAHEYQFRLNHEDAQRAFRESVEFMKARVD